METLHFFPNRKMAVRFCVAEYLKPARTVAVASVHMRSGQVGAGKDSFLTEKQAERVAVVRKMLAEGKNPFTHQELKSRDKEGKGQSLTPEEREARRLERVKLTQERIEQERIPALEEKWSTKNIERFEPIAPVILEDVDLGPALSNDPDDKTLRCSFCGNPVDEINATRGSGIPTMRVEIESELLSDTPPERIVTEKRRFSAEKLVACPDCCLNIQPRLGKDGNVIPGTGTKFGEILDRQV